MTIIGFKKHVGIMPALAVDKENGDFVFSQPMGYEDYEITSLVSAQGDRIESKASFEMLDDDVQILRDHETDGKLPKELSERITLIYNQLSKANSRIFQLILQELQVPDEPTLTSGGPMLWSTDGKLWKGAPGWGITIADVEVHPLMPLTAASQEKIQGFLIDQESPLIALTHLREAQKRSGRRFRWVEATIAAELAIKEILIRLEPKLETLLLEVPSPPIRKLYGIILQSVAGEKSPFVSALGKGAEMRNRIVHRPESVSFGPQETADYVATVAKAIRHLLELARKISIGKLGQSNNNREKG